MALLNGHRINLPNTISLALESKLTQATQLSVVCSLPVCASKGNTLKGEALHLATAAYYMVH